MSLVGEGKAKTVFGVFVGVVSGDDVGLGQEDSGCGVG